MAFFTLSISLYVKIPDLSLILTDRVIFTNKDNMKNSILVILIITFSMAAHAAFKPISQPLTYRISPNDFYEPETKSCYHWMTAAEAKKWKKAKPYMTYISFDDQLKRAGKSGRGIFCWTHPAGSAAGGNLFDAIPEIYGDQLVRIDFVDDAVVYNRVLNRYLRWGEILNETSSFKKGIDTEIIYGNYTLNNFSWFQEIFIKDIRVIKSYTFDDPQMREFVKNDYERMINDELSFDDTHFFINNCQSGVTATCLKYKRILKQAYSALLARWQNDELPKGSIKTGKTRHFETSPILKND
jgi:hypothetical protein